MGGGQAIEDIVEKDGPKRPRARRRNIMLPAGSLGLQGIDDAENAMPPALAEDTVPARGCSIFSERSPQTEVEPVVRILAACRHNRKGVEKKPGEQADADAERKREDVGFQLRQLLRLSRLSKKTSATAADKVPSLLMTKGTGSLMNASAPCSRK